MDLNSIFTDFCKTLKNVENTSKIFAELNTDEERFKMAYDLSHDYLYELKITGVGKCAMKSKQVRENGNKHFQKKLYWESLKAYSESLALAPKGSEESALAMGNRSTCLLKLGYPEEALKDINEAISLSKDSAYKNKLNSRKEKCQKESLTKNSNRSNFEIPSVPSFSRSKSNFFNSASSVVKLSSNETLGRHLITSEEVKTGEILIVEKPFCSVLLPDHFYTHCADCFCRSVRLLPCEYCSTSMYCSEKCLKASQNKNHKIECAILSFLTRLKAWRMELLALRILIETSKQGENLDIFLKEVSDYHKNNNNNNQNLSHSYDSSSHFAAYNLIGNTAQRNVADLFYRSLIVSILVTVLEKHTNFFYKSKEDKQKFKYFSGGLMLRYMQSLPCNAHEISEYCEDGLSEIGAGLYNTLSLINHSCDPNVVRHCYGDVVVLRSIRPIRKDEEIVDNYGYHYATHSYEVRQEALSKQYYFECRCRACEELWPLYEDLPDENPPLKEGTKLETYEKNTQLFKGYLDDILKGNFDGDTIKHLCMYLDFLEENVQRPWKPYNKCQEAIKHCLSFYGNHFQVSASK